MKHHHYHTNGDTIAAAQFSHQAYRWAQGIGGAIADSGDDNYHTTTADIKRQSHYIPPDANDIANEVNHNGMPGDDPDNNTQPRRRGRPKLLPHQTKQMTQRRRMLRTSGGMMAAIGKTIIALYKMEQRNALRKRRAEIQNTPPTLTPAIAAAATQGNLI